MDDTGDEGFAGTALAISPDGKELALGLVNGHVNLYDLPTLEFKSILVRFTAPVLGLDYGMEGEVMWEPALRSLFVRWFGAERVNPCCLIR